LTLFGLAFRLHDRDDPREKDPVLVKLFDSGAFVETPRNAWLSAAPFGYESAPPVSRTELAPLKLTPVYELPYLTADADQFPFEALVRPVKVKVSTIVQAELEVHCMVSLWPHPLAEVL
jgi:hypothetical protein